MAWKSGYNAALGMGTGLGAILTGAVDATAKVAVGTTMKAYDDVFGEGEFIYLPGVAATVAGDLVSYDLIPGAPVTTRALAAGVANSGRPVAVALSPVLATQYGWYQIGGTAIVNIVGAGVVGPLFATATAGQGSSAATAGSQILGARISTAVGTPAAARSYVTLSRPTVQSQIT